MKAKDLKNETLEALESKVRESREKLMELRFQQSGGTIKSGMDIRKTKREIAGLLTVINEKKKDE